MYYKEIKPKKSIFSFDLRELWQFKDLFYFFAWRDIKVMYKQTVLGVLWAVLQPVITMLIFTFLFGSLAKIDSNGVPYPVFVFSGLIFWNLFSTSLNSSSLSVVNFQGMIRKIYFPRIIIPVSSIFTNVANFLVASVIFIGLSIYYGYSFSIENIVVFVIVSIMTILTTLGPGLFFSVVNVKYRDVKYALPFAISTLMYLTPVIYPISFLTGNYKYLMAINPMAVVIQLMRDSLFGTNQVDIQMIVISLASILAMLIVGLLYFNKGEAEFADQI